MRLDIFARRALAGQVVDAAPCQLLLEGDWPDSVAGPARRLALDEQLDGRWQWIDHEADRLAVQIASAPPALGLHIEGLRVDWLCALELRYYLVRLVRVAAYLDGFLASERVTSIRLFADSQHDADYARVIGQLCRLNAIPVETHSASVPCQAVGPSIPARIGNRFPRVRATLARFSRRWDRFHEAWVSGRMSQPHVNRCARQKLPVVVCGHPFLFDPICESLVRRGTAPVYWLAERFAVRSFGRWRWRGVRFLECGDGDSLRGQSETAPTAPVVLSRNGFTLSALRFGGIDLSGPVANWLRHQTKRLEDHLGEAIRRLGEHYERIRPEWLLVDEDATPFKRAAVAVARERGIATAVVQHGAPYVAFGFAPLVADYLFAWGESSRRQFLRWGLPDESLIVTGCPKHDAWFASPTVSLEQPRVGWAVPTKTALDHVAAAHPARAHSLPNPVLGLLKRHLLLLTTVHHAPERPDLVGFHLTARTNLEMVRWVLEAVRQRPGWTLTIKLHPRTPDRSFFEDLVNTFPDLRTRVRILETGDVLALARRADCVLSCASSAGIEAMLADRPVIQLMPRGSVELVDPEDWGFAGTARSSDDLDELLSQIDGWDGPDEARLKRNFGNRQGPAAAQIVEFLSRKSTHTRKPGTERPTVSASLQATSRVA